MQRFFEALWYQKRWRYFAYLLWPLSFLYRALALLSGYSQRKNRIYFRIPILIIGNLTTGGTGKTPILITLTRILQSEGLKVGIVSRGYKSEAERASRPTLVTSAHTAQQVGDEPLLIFEKTGAPMAIHAKRPHAVQALIAKHPDLDLILSDDGLQNASLTHDLTLILIDAKRRFGNGLLLPAGPLREPVRRLSSADFRVINGEDFMLKPSGFRKIDSIESCALPPTQPIYAVSGIANPARFFETLTNLGLNVKPVIFRDHHAFKAKDFRGMEKGVIIMTEKDAVKCKDFGFSNAYVLTMEGEFTETFLNDFLNKVRYTIKHKHSELTLFKQGTNDE